MTKGYIIDTLTSVDIHEIDISKGKVFEIYEGVIYRENFKISSFRKVLEKLFALGQKYEDEHNSLMQELLKLIMDSLNGAQIRRDIYELYCCKSEHWMQAEYDEKVLDYWRLPNGKYNVKMKKDDGLDDHDCGIKNTLPGQLGSFIFSNSKRIMNNFIREKIEYNNNNIYSTDADSLYIEKRYWKVLREANLVGKKLYQGKNDYNTGGIFYGFFLPPKTKYCLTIEKNGIIQQHMTFQGFNDSKRLLDRSHYFDMFEGKKISAMLPRSRKKSFNNGIVIPVKMRRCNNWKNEILCKEFNIQINENKEFEANLNLLKRDVPNELVHLLPYYKNRVCYKTIEHSDILLKIISFFSKTSLQ